MVEQRLDEELPPLNMFGKNEVVTKALSLIQKLQHKYGFKPKFYEISSDSLDSDTPESNSPELYTPEPFERDELPTITEEPEDFEKVCILIGNSFDFVIGLLTSLLQFMNEQIIV